MSSTAPNLDDYSEITKDAVAFALGVIGAEPQRWQRKVLRDISDPDVRRIAVKSCHGPGKTWLAAVAVLYWLSTKAWPKVPCTAPTEHQLYDNLWPEVHKVLRKSKLELWRYLRWTKTKVSAINPATGESDPEWFAVARVSRVTRTASSDQGEAYGLQGFHADDLLFVVDEASGVPDPVYAAIEGALATGYAKILAIGNPNTPSGWFWRAFHRDQSEWSLHTVTHEDSPRVSSKWAASMERRYGRQHPWVQVRVYAEFPSAAEKGLVGLWAWERASEPAHARRLLDEVGGRRTLGVDVARYGTNRSVIAYATGPVVHKLEAFSKRSTGEMVGEVIRAIRSHKPEIVVVDAGNTGAAVIDGLREQRIPNVLAWYEGGATSEPDEYINARAELAWKFKDAIESLEGPEIAVPRDDDAEAQAINIRYYVQRNGKIRLEDKDELAKRMDSPDEFDAIRYALVPFLIGPTTIDGGVVVPVGRVGTEIPESLLLG